MGVLVVQNYKNHFFGHRGDKLSINLKWFIYSKFAPQEIQNLAYPYDTCEIHLYWTF